jgi:tRNA A-37 threonylcarbamoyl transferase component Bud32
MLDAPGLVGGRYRPERLLAASGMADVYAARDERLDRPVALKFLRADGATDAARFRREMTTLAHLEHPSLVRLYDADVHDARPYLVLELVDGPSLAQHLAQQSDALDGDETARVLADMAGALTYVHERGIVHRDVKPSNVLLDPEGRARLTDFGIAHTTDATAMTGTAMTIGTAAYLAPEQARGDGVTSAADIYSLGLVLLECRTGVRAFPGSAVEAAVARLSRDPEIPASLEPEWQALLSAMTAREPSARPTAADLAANPLTTRDAPATAAIASTDIATVAMASTDLAAAPAVTATAPMHTAVPPGPRRRAPSRAVVAGLALAALLVVVAVGIGLARGSDQPSLDAVRAPAATTPTTATAPSTTVPPPTSTSPPTTTAAPVVAAASNCADLAAQRKALDEQKKATPGPKGGADVDHALEDRKHQLDDALKSCHAH